MPEDVEAGRAASGSTPVRRAVTRGRERLAWAVSNDPDAVGEATGEDDQLRRVRLYTVGSLLLIMWAVAAFVTAAVALGPGGPVDVAVAAGLVALAAVGTRLVRTVAELDDRMWRTYARPLFLTLAILVATLAVILLGARDEVRDSLLVVTFLSAYASLGALRVSWVWGLLLGLTAVALLLAGVDLRWLVLILAGAVAMLWTFRVTFWIYDVVQELARRRQAGAALAVVQERLRFARDLHDVMGRDLSAIAVNADLAATLARRGDERAPERMDQVRDLAHDSLAEVRSLVRGYRAIDLDTELAGSRSLLEAAGIEVTADLTDEHLSPSDREAVAWVLREGVTNVLRHAQPTRVLVRTSPGTLELRNDGVGGHDTGTGTSPGPGSGLTGLRERLDAVGATLTVQRADGEFALLVRFEAAGPLPRTEGSL